MTGEQMLSLLGQGTLDTLVMVLPSLVLATLLGLPLGVGAYLTAPGSLRPNPAVNKTADWNFYWTHRSHSSFDYCSCPVRRQAF